VSNAYRKRPGGTRNQNKGAKIVKVVKGTIWTDKKRTFIGLPISFTRYMLTETKLIIRTGFLNVNEDEIELYKITDRKLVFPLGQRIFGCATIKLSSFDVTTPKQDLKSIKKARDVYDLLDDAISAQKDKYNVRGRELTGMAFGDSSGGGD
jgi:hypothetical protein